MSEQVESDWVRYLKCTDNYERYDGMCDCYVCRQIAKDFEVWKANHHKNMSEQPSIEPLRRFVNEVGAPDDGPESQAIAAYDNLKQRAERLEVCLDHIASYAATVRTDRRYTDVNFADDFQLQTTDWCEGLLEQVTHARTVLSENTKEETKHE